MDKERYSRQIMLPEIGEEGQRRLLRSSVLVVGVGGLGSAAALYLTAAGVGRIGLADPDRVSVSNLQRQVLYTQNEVGMKKSEMAQLRLKALSPLTTTEGYDSGLSPQNARQLIGDYDLVIDCCDNFATRYLIDDVCHETGKPWIHGAIGDFTGQVALFNGRRRVRYTHLYPDREELCRKAAAAQGVIGTLPGIIGTIEASEAIKYIVGMDDTLDGRLFRMDTRSLRTEILEL